MTLCFTLASLLGFPRESPTRKGEGSRGSPAPCAASPSRARGHPGPGGAEQPPSRPGALGQARKRPARIGPPTPAGKGHGHANRRQRFHPRLRYRRDAERGIRSAPAATVLLLPLLLLAPGRALCADPGSQRVAASPAQPAGRPRGREGSARGAGGRGGDRRPLLQRPAPPLRQVTEPRPPHPSRAGHSQLQAGVGRRCRRSCHRRHSSPSGCLRPPPPAPLRAALPRSGPAAPPRP